MSYGFVNDQYFYVDEKGNRTPIDNYCTHEGVSGGSMEMGGKEMLYKVFQVTNSECGEDFFLDGNERYTAQVSEIVKFCTGLYN
jgi:hypothetical protein